jgi:large subunit ribosomal protein L4
MAHSAKVIDARGKASGERELPDALFGSTPNISVMHQVVTAQLAAARSGTASTKTRSEVRGGGKKPWRQKGTGRARHGSIRSPLWVGGGIVFGPRPRRHNLRVNKKMRKGALRSALGAKASEGRVWILDGFDSLKTKDAVACLEAAEIRGRTLMVLDSQAEDSPAVDRAFKNLGSAAFTLQQSLSAYDVLVADAVVFTSGSFDRYVAQASEGVTS